MSEASASASAIAERPADPQVSARPAWIAIALVPVGFVLAVLVTILLAAVLDVDFSEGPPRSWRTIVIDTTAAVVVLAIPSVALGRAVRSARSGNGSGRAAAAVAGALFAGLLVFSIANFTTGTTTPGRSLEDAVGGWVEDSGSKYVGSCPVDFDPDFPLDGLCAVPLSADGDRSVQGVGPPFSEVTAYLLLERGDDGWTVVDAYTPTHPYDLGDAPDWVADELTTPR